MNELVQQRVTIIGAKSPYDMPHTTYQEVGLYNQVTQQFITNYPGDVFFGSVSVALDKAKNPLGGIVDTLKAPLTNARAVMPHDIRTISITGEYKGNDVLIWVDVKEYSTVYKMTFKVIASHDGVHELIRGIFRSFDDKKMPVVRWWFEGRHGPEIKDFYLPSDTQTIRPEYYPDMDDPEKFLIDYMQSDESILMVAGPPGTGKTTLLRHLITKYRLRAHVIYDENILKKDGPFQSFLFGDEDYGPSEEEDAIPQQDIMVIEDADSILTSRERDGNKLMSRFLNVADGLIKLPNKKLVFTTNVIDFGNVDSALIRPGRCFAVLHTRLLNLSEAQAAAKAASLPIPLTKREYALAEIFNSGNTATVRQIGFGTRHA